MASLVEQVRIALAKRDGISEEAMRPLAMQYASEVTRVNARLSAAVTLLHKGLRSEAIQNASMTPNAIDDAARLDFAEAEEWFDILQFLGIDVPPTLQRDLADQLNEAIVDTQPLDVLLRKHRRLAIARAPLQWRLKVLRRIAEIDSMNSVWEDDLESWEKVRLKQLQMESTTAIARGDHAALREIATELANQSWRAPQDPSLLKNVRNKLAQLDEAETQSQLSLLGTQVHDAFCQFDEPGARAALAQWRSVAANLRGEVPQELAEQIEGATAWIEEMDREATLRAERAQAVGALESALDRGDSLVILEREYHRAMTFDEPPPMELLQRYQLAHEERTLVKKRRFQLVVGAIVAATLLVMVSLVWWQYKSNQSLRITTAEREFRTLVEAANIPSAVTFYDNLKANAPDLVSEPGIVSLATQLATLVSNEQARAAQFAEYIAAADHEDASQMDLVSLNQAERIAATEAEKGQIFSLRRRHSQWQAGLEAEHTAKFVEALTSEREELTEIETGPASAEAETRLAAVIERLETLPKTYPRAPRTTRDQGTSTLNRAVAMRKAVKASMLRTQQETEALDEVFASVSLNELGRNLEAYAKRHPASPVASEFAAAAAEAKLWAAGLYWNDYAQQSAKTLAGRMLSSDVQQWRAMKALLQTKVQTPPGQLPALAAERLDTYDNRAEILGRVLGGLKETVIADLLTVTETAGDKHRVFIYSSYYERNRSSKFVDLDPVAVPSRSIEAVVDASGAVKGVSVNGMSLVVSTEPQATINWIIDAYNSRRNEFLADWEGEFLKLAGELRGRSGLDTYVKQMLFQHVLVGACEGSQTLSKSLSNELRLLNSLPKAQDQWYLPRVPSDALDSQIEQGIIPKLATIYRSRPKADVEIAAVRKLQCEWVGIMTRANDVTSVRLTNTKPVAGRLLVMRESAVKPGAVDWVQVGEISEGKVTLGGARVDQVAGRPVFVCP